MNVATPRSTPSSPFSALPEKHCSRRINEEIVFGEIFIHTCLAMHICTDKCAPYLSGVRSSQLID